MVSGKMTTRRDEQAFMKRTVAILCIATMMVSFGCRMQSAPPAPVIGITSVYKLDEKDNSANTLVNFAYVRAVAENGGVPVILPTVDSEEIIVRYVHDLDGLVLVGGADIPPAAYGQQPHETVKPLPAERYEFERKLIAHWLAGGKPVLGVCLGMQFTNVVSGGSLIQDIPSQVGTEVKHRGYHLVEIEPGSSLSKTLGHTQASVYSNHHQAVKDVGNGLKVIAHSDDGTIEALERVGGGFGLFVQWHPEQMDDKQHRDAIYGALVRAAAWKR